MLVFTNYVSIIEGKKCFVKGRRNLRATQKAGMQGAQPLAGGSDGKRAWGVLSSPNFSLSYCSPPQEAVMSGCQEKEWDVRQKEGSFVEVYSSARWLAAVPVVR